MDLDINRVDWQMLLLVIEKKIHGRELSKRLGITNQAIGHWRRGIQKPSLTSAVALFDLLAEYFMTEEERRGSVEDYFNKLNSLLPRYGEVLDYQAGSSIVSGNS